MKIVLDLALSVDGYIARPDGDSSWVSERTEKLFKQRIQELGSLVVGSTTFEQYRGSIYPVEGALNIILSKSPKLIEENIVYASSPEDAVRICAERKFEGMLIAGGAAVSKAFLEKGLIDEVYFSIHPIQLGKGMRPFGDREMPTNLTLLDSVDLGEGIKQDHYRIEK